MPSRINLEFPQVKKKEKKKKKRGHCYKGRLLWSILVQSRLGQSRHALHSPWVGIKDTKVKGIHMLSDPHASLRDEGSEPPSEEESRFHAQDVA